MLERTKVMAMNPEKIETAISFAPRWFERNSGKITFRRVFVRLQSVLARLE